MSDASDNALTIAWLPKANAEFITVSDDDVLVSFQGVQIHDSKLCGIHRDVRTVHYHGITHGWHRVNKRTKELTYWFGRIHPGLDLTSMYGRDYFGGGLEYDLKYQELMRDRTTAFDHPLYFINQPAWGFDSFPGLNIRD
jgi:hypothetical protein